YDYLKPGETTDLVVTFQASDGDATSNGWPVTLTVSGVNDAATITGDTTGTVTEDSGVAATGKLTVTDLDHDESHTEQATDVAAKYGTWSVDADGNWSYKLDDSNADVNKLGAKDTLTDTFTVNSLDGSASQSVTITIQGHN